MIRLIHKGAQAENEKNENLHIENSRNEHCARHVCTFNIRHFVGSIWCPFKNLSNILNADKQTLTTTKPFESLFLLAPWKFKKKSLLRSIQRSIALKITTYLVKFQFSSRNSTYWSYGFDQIDSLPSYSTYFA